jgi:uncharacterized protein
MARRDVRLSEVRGKALAVIAMRRSGKSTFLRQFLADRLAAGASRESLLYFSFEGERLAGLQMEELSWIVEEFFRVQPGLRDARKANFFSYEIQAVVGG